MELKMGRHSKTKRLRLSAAVIKHKRKSVPERYEVAKSFKVCFNCLEQGHRVNKCSNKTHCQVTNCKRHHHSLLHYERATPQPPPGQDPQTQPPLTPGNALPYVATTNSLAANDERVVYFQVGPGPNTR